jgi:hypothetical protein
LSCFAGFERGGQPLRLQAAAGPGLAGDRVAILGGDLAAARARARAARSWQPDPAAVKPCSAISAPHLGYRIAALLAARIGNLAIDFGLLGQQFLQG